MPGPAQKHVSQPFYRSFSGGLLPSFAVVSTAHRHQGLKSRTASRGRSNACGAWHPQQHANHVRPTGAHRSPSPRLRAPALRDGSSQPRRECRCRQSAAQPLPGQRQHLRHGCHQSLVPAFPEDTAAGPEAWPPLRICRLGLAGLNAPAVLWPPMPLHGEWHGCQPGRMTPSHRATTIGATRQSNSSPTLRQHSMGAAPWRQARRDSHLTRRLPADAPPPSNTRAGYHYKLPETNVAN